MRIAFIGNCQVQTWTILTQLMLDGSEVRVFDYSEPYSVSEDARRSFADGLEGFDWIFAQTASKSYTGEKDLRSRYGGKLITLANFYFRGLFPDSCFLGDFERRVIRPTTVHNAVLVKAFRDGLNETEALRQFDINVMDKMNLLAAWSSGMEEMRRREQNGTVDVRAAELMEASSRAYPAFLTMNHPSASLLHDYLQEVFRFAGIKHRYINPQKIRDPLSIHDTTPILDEVAEYLNLPYRVSQNWKINSLGGRFVNRERYVAACYNAYQGMDTAQLLIHSPTDLVASLLADPDNSYLVHL